MNPEPPGARRAGEAARGDRASGRRRSRSGVAALAVVGLIVTAWAVAASPLFHLRTVRVDGNRHLSESEVVRLAALPGDTNLLTLPLHRVERAVGESPWIHEVEVRRSFPSTLVLSIEERAPVAWVRLPKGIVVVAGDGTVLARRAKPAASLVGIGTWDEPLEPGTRLEGLSEPLAVAASLPPRVRRDVAGAFLRRGELVVRLDQGALVRYGQLESLDEKNAALAKVIGWAGERGASLTHVDLRAPRNPAVRVADG